MLNLITCSIIVSLVTNNNKMGDTICRSAKDNILYGKTVRGSRMKETEIRGYVEGLSDLRANELLEYAITFLTQTPEPEQRDPAQTVSIIDFAEQ